MSLGRPAPRRAWSGYSDDEIRAIGVPMLLIIGDSDIVKPEHTAQLFRLLGGGVAGDMVGLPESQLAILPGTTHITLVEKADWLVSMIEPFLDATATEARAKPPT